MRIALAFDHRGDQAGIAVAQYLRDAGHDVDVLGEVGERRRDYPDAAWAVGRAVSNKHADRGILICGSGIGVCIAANKLHGIRAALVRDLHAAELSRTHNDSNVICLSADETPMNDITAIIDRWLEARFEGGRHARRLEKIHAIEHGMDPRDVHAHAIADMDEG